MPPHYCELGGPRFQRIDAGGLSVGHLAAGFNAKRSRGQRRDRPPGHRIQRKRYEHTRGCPVCSSDYVTLANRLGIQNWRMASTTAGMSRHAF